MRLEGCAREQDSLTAALSGEWAHPRDGTLKEHVASCVVCRDLVEIALLFSVERDEVPDATVPSPGQVWWRAAIRSRLEATETAGRPFLWLYGAMVVSTAVLAVAWSRPAWSSVRDVPAWILTRVASVDVSWIGVETTPAIVSLGWTLAILAAIALVLAPLALFFAPDD